MAQGAGLNYRDGHRISLQVGDGSFILVYLHDLELQIGLERFLAAEYLKTRPHFSQAAPEKNLKNLSLTRMAFR